MERKPGEDRGADVGKLISTMGQERMALRARKTTVLLMIICSFICLGTAVGGYTGYVFPHAAGPATIFLLAALTGFVLSVVVAGRA
jgi:hypothetical protein